MMLTVIRRTFSSSPGTKYCPECPSRLCNRRRFVLELNQSAYAVKVDVNKSMIDKYRSQIGGYFVGTTKESLDFGEYKCDQLTDKKDIFMCPTLINNNTKFDMIIEDIKKNKPDKTYTEKELEKAVLVNIAQFILAVATGSFIGITLATVIPL